MRWLIAMESSGVIRRALRARGHDAWSCDLLASEDDSPHHIIADARTLLRDGWDGLIAHPPCTDLAVSGSRWFKAKAKSQQDALDFFCRFLCAPIEMIAVENPISVVSSWVRKPDQIIQPWQFGHGETKATCLWLKNLPPLRPTNIVEGREARVHRMSPGPNRWRERSRTLPGIGEAMAAQWGGPIQMEIAA